jgi:hypothetical protein
MCWLLVVTPLVFLIVHYLTFLPFLPNQELKDYRKAVGHVNVPARFDRNPELGVWVGTQRTQYRLYTKAKESGEAALGTSSMNEDRIAQLEEIGFVWAIRNGELKRGDSGDLPTIEEESMRIAEEMGAGKKGGGDYHQARVMEQVVMQIAGQIRVDQHEGRTVAI